MAHGLSPAPGIVFRKRCHSTTGNPVPVPSMMESPQQ